MPIFYFHLHNDEDVPDCEGQEFTDLNEARAQAEHQTRLFVGESVKETGKIDFRHFVAIEDAEGNLVDRVFFGDVVAVEGSLGQQAAT